MTEPSAIASWSPAPDDDLLKTSRADGEIASSADVIQFEPPLTVRP